VTHKGKRT